MNTELDPREAARGARRAGLALEGERPAEVAATANHIQAVVATLRELDFEDTPPATSYKAVAQEDLHAAL
ncbi:hypothetical protein ACIPW9_21665 [Streptomyces sp. NPDC090052]|uniref:hypothetical protein n=1 Tax=unclassified Streptomyces TaxID=2593676 RepID=UPI003806E8B8|nr:hypothetical protein OG760_00540 [Streptomyces sp. NBC_00963]